MTGADPFETALQADRERRARQVQERWDPAPDPSLRQAREAAAATTAKLHQEIRGADAQLDQAVLGLSRLGVELEQTLHSAAGIRARVESGSWSREEYERVLGAVADQARRDIQERYKAAETELAHAEERILDELMPVPARSPETAETKADLQLAIGSTPSGDPDKALLQLWRRCLSTQDHRALGILRSDWGRDLFVSRGGSAAAWDGIRRQMIQEAVSGPFRNAPAAKRLDKLRSTGLKAVQAQMHQASGTLDRLRQAISR